ncbi:MAG: methionine aminotransferase [Methylococcaceae bacterium]|nr:methionine aminotransferase [Methylococcaceae bacterium]
MHYPKPITSKLPNVGTTIFTVMSQLATHHNAINLSQGFPDFDCDPALPALVSKFMQSGHNQYAPMAGILGLREILAEKTSALYGADYDAEQEITITAGATQAIFTAITAIIREGDEVIVFDPAYDSYQPAIELNGGITIHIQLQAPDYTIDWTKVSQAITPRTRMIIINTPHNPTGTVLSAQDMIKLTEVTLGTDIVIISDEVYEHIIFDDQAHQSVARYPSLAERSFIISSFGKTFHATGWKIGYCVAPKALMVEFRKVHQFLVFCTNTPVQFALAEYLKQPHHYLELGHFYQQKRDYFIGLIKGSQFELKPAAGTYFQLLSYKKLSQEKDTDYAIRLTKECGVASIPVSVFFQEAVNHHVLRFCFAKKNETLEKAAVLLRNLN